MSCFWKTKHTKACFSTVQPTNDNTHDSFQDDGDRNDPRGFGDLVFYQVEHVLVVEQPDQVKRAETGSRTQSQIPDHHRTENAPKITRLVAAFSTNAPVEAPLEEELARCLRETGFAFVGLEGALHDVLQPGGPLLERVLLLQGQLEVVLEAGDDLVVALAHPGGLLAHAVEVDAVQVGQHLGDLGAVVEDRPRRLSQVVEGGVASQARTERRHCGQLDGEHAGGGSRHGAGQPVLQVCRKTIQTSDLS
jgi:hypothetical protein